MPACESVDVGEAARISTAEALMRSRFDAFARRDVDYLLASWHPSTRPASLELDDDIEWRRLQIVDSVAGGEHDAEGVVEFRASYRGPQGAGLLHERSRFVRHDGLWVYLDGDLFD
jgi:SEC-C motif-containing protein